jgi:hypothetical protein
MKVTKEKPVSRLCASEGCRRPAEPGDRFCETCSIEWTLYRRDARVRAPVTPSRAVR